eukprot:Pgem_evm1s17874
MISVVITASNINTANKTFVGKHINQPSLKRVAVFRMGLKLLQALENSRTNVCISTCQLILADGDFTDLDNKKLVFGAVYLRGMRASKVRTPTKLPFELIEADQGGVF